MRGDEHVAIAAVATGAAAYALNGFQVDVATQAAAVGVAAAGSLVPDIDHPQAWISKRIPATLIGLSLLTLLGYAGMRWRAGSDTGAGLGAAMAAPMADMLRPLLGLAWVALATGAALLIVSIIIANVLEHRGPTHSLAVNVVLTVMATIVFAITGPSWTLGLWFGFGYLTHLLADMTTRMGCPSILWPAGTGMRVPVPTSMTRPGVQEIGAPSQTTSTVTSGSHPSIGGSEDLGASALASGAPHPEGIEQHD